MHRLAGGVGYCTVVPVAEGVSGHPPIEQCGLASAHRKCAEWCGLAPSCNSARAYYRQAVKDGCGDEWVANEEAAPGETRGEVAHGVGLSGEAHATDRAAALCHVGHRYRYVSKMIPGVDTPRNRQAYQLGRSGALRSRPHGGLRHLFSAASQDEAFLAVRAPNQPAKVVAPAP